MSVQLPPQFVQRMQDLLGDEFQSFMDSYEQSPRAGLRVNTLKISNEQFQKQSPFELRSIPWCPTGYYVDAAARPGKHPYYYAGLYYIQEPSAMSPVEALEVQPGDRVLDLCAAPGGKSTQIAAALQGQGLLVTNDLSAERTRALAKNMELYGVRNAVILNESPDVIATRFAGFFDKILVDAPCSGEGMFRKDDDAARQWLNHSVERCSIMQRDILQTVATMLAPGGRIVYSTCTFAPEENERSIAVFLDQHPEFSVTLPAYAEHFRPGRSEWASQVEQEIQQGATVLSAIPTEGYTPVSEKSIAQTAQTVRLWPHLLEGEGHYIAVLDHQAVRDRNYVPAEPPVIAHSHKERPQRHTASRPDQRIDKKAERRAERDARKGRTEGRDKSGRQHSVSRIPATEELSPLQLWQEFSAKELNGEWGTQGIITFGHNLYRSPIGESRLQGLKVIRPGWYLGSCKNGRFTPGHALAAALIPAEAKRRLNLSADSPEAISYLKGETLSVPAERIQCDEDVSSRGYVLVCIDGCSAGWGKWQQGDTLKNEYPAGWRWI
ncbi:RsmB/NOP family class I SAM-dependent RNA methyltransferase [Paenibacillus bovis]|uniref:rRNA cytosine-C5-methyltransferase n=1 Tax=Paenibacillus bovis TaxID=1616788 RepID=A0A172ZFJ1_9BACL|nr:RsmB/NOP family class I SAM-dependent RNA methyltransferase [Paenibacillus bovis]ANF96395.1 rRNA cytosine-C5-methyltransferase [Paenibacillus bovis]